jgi:hypothetical protein
MPSHTDAIAQAQHDMRFAYLGGGPGMLASSLVWLGAALVSALGAHMHGVWALLVGGMFIHPLGQLLARAMGRPARHAPGNALARLAMETTIWMVLAMLVCVGVAMMDSAMFYPAMLLVIGGRYFTFATIYGDRIYWLVGLLLAVAGWTLAASHAAAPLGGFAGAAIELVFGVVICARARLLRPGAA